MFIIWCPHKNTMLHQRITIVRYVRPQEQDVNSDLQWFGNALGLFSLRDKDKSCFRMFITMLKGAKVHHAFSSDELAHHLNLSRATVVHHLNKLMEAGIVVQQGSRYALRVETLSLLIDEIRKDLERSLLDLTSVAKEIDEALGL